MAALKTYILAPNFTFERDGPIRLGNIIADPFRPTKVLSTLSHEPLTAKHTDFECSFTREKSRSLRGGVWAQFLQTASASVGGGGERATTSEYTMDSLETVRLKQDPSDEEAAARSREPKVQAAIKSGLSGAAPVYIVTGLMIAKAFRFSRSVTSTRSGNVGAGVPVTAEVGVGMDVDASTSTTVGDSMRSGSDIIFAYQLHTIASKGWWHKRVEAEVYAPKSAFLNNDQRVVEEEIGVQASTCEELLEVARENEEDSIQTLDAKNGDEPCICISV